MCARVKDYRKTMQAAGLMLMGAAMLSGCSSQSEIEPVVTPAPVVVTEPEPISLVFACAPNAIHAATRMTGDVVQSGSTYRDITDFGFVTLRTNESGILAIPDSQVDTPETPENKTSARYYHFSYCDMAQGVNQILVYAKAKDVAQPTDQAKKAYNGSLTATIPQHVTALSDISFAPEPIYPDVTDVPTEATALADAMTAVVTSQWRASNHSVLQNLLGNFTNHGFNLPGSAASVKSWLKALSDAAQSYIDNESSLDGSYKDILRAVKTQAETAANAITIDATSYPYPRGLNLPDGGAALRWVDVGGNEGMKFVPQLQTTTLDDINTVSRFVYPPALYYFVNSGIKTSNTKVTLDNYRGETSWADVLANHFTSGTSINSSTKTVAIADPLQYAVARLSLKVKANGESLPYRQGEGNIISINDGGSTNFFRLTGVIVSGQRPVDYQFKPASNLDSDMKFVYDSQVDNDFYLTTTDFNDANAKVYNTLLLQSCDGEDVNVILEFEYTGTQAFRCLNGYVYPNTRFYLVGEVKADQFKTETGDAASQGRVFTQDYTTTIEMTVTSLEKAYNVLPSILAKNLEIGVQTTPKWVAVKPTGPVIMD